MYDVAMGISYLHTRRPAVLHRDLKSNNVLIDANGRCKISDFGLAAIKQRRKQLTSVVGTINWQAPEMWRADPKYSEKVDVYSAGLVFWEIFMWHGEIPYEDMRNDHEIYHRVGVLNERPNLKVRKVAADMAVIAPMIEQMWSPDPHERPDMMDILTTLSKIV